MFASVFARFLVGSPYVLFAAVVLVVASLARAGLAEEPEAAMKNWPQWRGPAGTGVAPMANPPTEWSEKKNVKWKFEIPGYGTSSPIVWNDQVLIQTAIARGKPEKSTADAKTESAIQESPRRSGQERGRGQSRGRRRRGGFFGGRKPTEVHEFVLLSVDRETGTLRWKKALRKELPHEGHHRDHGFASASPVTDGRHVVSFFGSRGLYCLDMKGELRWEKDLGDMRIKVSFGEGASPVIHGNTVVVNWDHEGDSFITALNIADGTELWKKSRREQTTWVTPLIVDAAGKTQVIVNGSRKAISYDLTSGDVIWECSGQTSNVIPTPVVGHGMVFLMSGFRGASLQAVDLTKTGDMNENGGIVWSLKKGTPYVPSPLLYDDLLYFFQSNRATLSCLDAKTGKAHLETRRLEELGGIYASPVGAGGRVYLTDRDGKFLVIKNSPELEILATNELEDKFDASPAAAGKELFVRGHKYLYCIAES